MTTSGADREEPPPPAWALGCPREQQSQTDLFVRTDWFYCDSCSRFTDHSPRLYFVRDLQHDRLLSHPKFAERWGVHVSHDTQW